MVNRLREVDADIAKHQYGNAAGRLEPLSAQGLLTPGDEIALALLLMWPPLAAWDDSLAHLRTVMRTPFAFEAAVWGAYICDTLYPVTDEFHDALKMYTNRAEACYLLAVKAMHSGDSATTEDLITRCNEIESFPNSLYIAWLYCSDKSKAENLIREAMLGVRDHGLELRPPPHCRDKLRQRNWSELIRGEIVTSHIWNQKYGEHL